LKEIEELYYSNEEGNGVSSVSINNPTIPWRFKMSNKNDYTSLVDTFKLTYINGEWLNATRLCNVFKKNLDDYILSDNFKEYAAICFEDMENPGEMISHYTDDAGDVLINPELGIDFCRWVDMEFGLHCNHLIFGMLEERGLSFADVFNRFHGEVLNTLNMGIRRHAEYTGIEVTPEVFTREEYMINEALTGKHCAIQVSKLSVDDIQLLETLEVENCAFYLLQIPFEKRKEKVNQIARDWRNHRGVVRD